MLATRAKRTIAIQIHEGEMFGAKSEQQQACFMAAPTYSKDDE